MSTDREPVAAPATEPDDHGQPVVTIAGDCAQATGQVFNDGQLQVRAIGVRMMATGSAYVIVRPGQNGVVSLTLSPDWSALPAAAPANQDIVDEIDALVEEQMTGGEPLTGYFYGDPTYPKCPNPWCREPWHGLAITQRMARMRLLRTLDPSYRHADDTSAVLCPGSLHTGEYTPPPDRWASVSPLVVQYQQRRWTAAPQPVVYLRGAGRGDDVWAQVESAMWARGWRTVRDRTAAWHLARGGVPVVLCDFSTDLADSTPAPGGGTWFGYNRYAVVGRVRARYDTHSETVRVEELLTTSDRARLMRARAGWLEERVERVDSEMELPLVNGGRRSLPDGRVDAHALALWAAHAFAT